MAIQTGTTADHHAAMALLRTFLIAQGWTVLRWTTAATLADPLELAVRPIGTGSFRPTITFRSIADTPNGLYHWMVSGAEDYNALATQLGQPNSSPVTYVPLSNNPMTYWFYANDRRVICVFKVGSSYSNLYAGLFLPYSFPNEYRRPLYIAGNYRSQIDINTANIANSAIANPGLNAASVMDRADLWVYCHNRSDSTAAEPNFISNTSSCFIWPTKTQQGSGASQSGATASWQHYGMILLRPNAAGEMPLFQCQIMSPMENSNAGAILGALDGVYDTGGFNRTAEQVVTFGGNNFRLFPNMYRSGPNNFMAIEEI